MGVRVLSLFDGISVGYSALIREGFAIEKYYASEIDRFAIAVSAANHHRTAAHLCRRIPIQGF